MNSNYKIVYLISFFLLLLAGGSSVSNYLVSMESTERQIKTQSLPLSVDNIYTAIQKNIIQPSLVASMMASDTFLIEWLQEERSSAKIQEYLDSIKNKNGMMLTFLVSQMSLNYYTPQGVLRQIDKSDPVDAWYFDFKKSSQTQEINLDWNKHISDEMVMFINYKILDKNFHFIGATGVGIKISYIKNMLKMFKDNYQLRVSFLDRDGNILLSDNKEYKDLLHFDSIEALKPFKNQIFTQNSAVVEYNNDSSEYILQTKYIPELNVYLLVEAKLDDFTSSTKNTFYFNLAISLFLTLIIAIAIIIIVQNFQKRLNQLADHDPLTLLYNRRSFLERFEAAFLLAKRSKAPLSLLFIDLDDFKHINDTFGHDRGDKVLQEFAKILRANIRSTDIYARWGGEEFTVAFIDSHAKESLIRANKIREAIRKSDLLGLYLNKPLTISAGLTDIHKYDTIDTFISRADKAMYQAKREGKDRVSLLNE